MLLKPWDERKRSSIKLKPLVQAQLSKIEGVNAFAFNLPPLPGGPGGLPVQMVIYSTNGFQSVYEQMIKLKDAARKSGLFIVSDSDLDFNQPVVRVKIDRSKASDLGITMQSIGDTLATLLGGNYVNRFNLEGRSYQVIPQVPRDQRLSPESLGEYYVPTSTGQQVPLSTVVSIETGTDPNALTHYNQLNSATFQAVPMPGVTVGQAVDFLEGEAKKLPAGFSHDYLADSRQYVQEGNQLAITFGFALIIIFLVLAAQFESLRDPLVIMVSVPMAIVGALIPLFFGVATMNIYTQVGLLTLVGLITKHGILMVEFANELQLNEGLDKRSAIEMAARIRLRPILMTTAAMVTGLLPLLTATGAGAASRFSIGLVVVAGMSIGTLFTLFVLPAVYVAIATDHRAGAESERAKQIADFDLEQRRRSNRPERRPQTLATRAALRAAVLRMRRSELCRSCQSRMRFAWSDCPLRMPPLFGACGLVSERTSRTMTTRDFTAGNYRFIPAVFQYSNGVAADPDFEIERVRFDKPAPAGRRLCARRRLHPGRGRPLTAFCACELRSPAPSPRTASAPSTSTTSRRWPMGPVRRHHQSGGAQQRLPRDRRAGRAVVLCFLLYPAEPGGEAELRDLRRRRGAQRRGQLSRAHRALPRHQPGRYRRRRSG